MLDEPKVQLGDGQGVTQRWALSFLGAKGPLGSLGGATRRFHAAGPLVGPEMPVFAGALYY